MGMGRTHSTLRLVSEDRSGGVPSLPDSSTDGGVNGPCRINQVPCRWLTPASSLQSFTALRFAFPSLPTGHRLKRLPSFGPGVHTGLACLERITAVPNLLHTEKILRLGRPGVCYRQGGANPCLHR